MDQTIAEITAPLVGNGIVVGHVSAIHEKGKEHVFAATEHELEQLALHWAGEIKWIQDEWEYNQQSGSTEIRLEPYAWRRLDKIIEVLGKDRVGQILEDVNKERFMTSVCEVPQTGGPSEPEDKVLYTERGRSAVFHPSRAGLRPMAQNAGFVGEGWCWQTAEDYKSGKPIEYFGYATVQEALQAAQQAEDTYFKEIEQELKAHEASDDWEQQRQRRAAEATEDLRAALAAHPVQGSYRVWSSDHELCERVMKPEHPLENRVEVRLRDGASEKSSTRIFIDWLTSEHWGYRVSVTVDASSEAWERHEALFHAMIAMQRRFSYINTYWSRLSVYECETILKAVGFADVTRPKPQGAGLF